MSRLSINLTLIVLFINILSSSGQTKKVMKETFYQGEMYLLYEEYNEALPAYDSLLSWFPENDNYNYRLGICYLNMPGHKERSLGYLQKAVQNINPKYKDGKFKEKAAAYDAWYFLAKAYLVTNQIDKALETYNRFYSGMDHKLYDSILVKREIEACHNAKRLMQVPLYLKAVNQGDVINDRYSDVNPVVSADENTLVYTRENPFQDQILYSQKVNDEWTPGLVIMDQLLVDEGYSTSLSGNGTELYLYRNDEYDGNIYSSQFINGRWMPAEKLNDNINTKYWESHASISADNHKLFFTSNIPGGFGGLDIYMSERDSTGDWGRAVNLGPTINTRFNEETPFLDKTDNILFFSSRGHFSMGGHDIFYTNQLEDGNWTAPVNMGFPVNSTDDDLFFHPVGQGYSAYISRFDPDGFGLKDIQRVEIFSDDHPRKFFVRGIVALKDLADQFIDSVKVSTLNRDNLDTLLIVYSNPNTGDYEFEVPQGEYQIVFESDGSEKVVSDLDLSLIHPVDSIGITKIELAKTDYSAELELIEGDEAPANITAGDTASVFVLTEPNSILVVEHWQGDSLLSTEEFIITDTLFKYDILPLSGDNNLKFTIKDRFNNITVREYSITGLEPEVTKVERITDIPVIVADIPADTQKVVTDPSIENLGQVISEVSDANDDGRIRDAVEEIKERDIKNAGEWLESLYNVALKNGADKEQLTNLIAALSAEMGESAEAYLSRLKGFATAKLKIALESIDLKEMTINSPEELISYLLENADKYGYNHQELFEAFAKMINSDKKSAEDIVDYILSTQGNKLWILWLLLGTGAFIFFIIWWRKRDKGEEKI